MPKCNSFNSIRGNPVNYNDPTGHQGEESAKLPESGGDPNATQEAKEQIKEEQSGNKDDEANKPPQGAEVKVYVVEGGFGHVALSVSVNGEPPTWWNSGGKVPECGEQGIDIENKFKTNYLQKDPEVTKVTIYTISTDPKEVAAVKEQIENRVLKSGNENGVNVPKGMFQHRFFYHCSISVADILFQSGFQTAANPLMIFPVSSSIYFDLIAKKKETFESRR